MYLPVKAWLQKHLTATFRSSTIEVHDTHASPLNQYIANNELHPYFDSDLWQTFDIRVDVTAFVTTPRKKGLVFVECKTGFVSLRDLSQLLGYSRVALPLQSFILSPAGIGGNLKTLIISYGREDILEYCSPEGELPRKIVIARWDTTSLTLDRNSLIPAGAA